MIFMSTGTEKNFQAISFSCRPLLRRGLMLRVLAHDGIWLLSVNPRNMPQQEDRRSAQYLPAYCEWVGENKDPLTNEWIQVKECNLLETFLCARRHLDFSFSMMGIMNVLSCFPTGAGAYESYTLAVKKHLQELECCAKQDLSKDQSRMKALGIFAHFLVKTVLFLGYWASNPSCMYCHRSLQGVEKVWNQGTWFCKEHVSHRDLRNSPSFEPWEWAFADHISQNRKFPHLYVYLDEVLEKEGKNSRHLRLFNTKLYHLIESILRI